MVIRSTYLLVARELGKVHAVGEGGKGRYLGRELCIYFTVHRPGPKSRAVRSSIRDFWSIYI